MVKLKRITEDANTDNIHDDQDASWRNKDTMDMSFRELILYYNEDAFEIVDKDGNLSVAIP